MSGGKKAPRSYLVKKSTALGAQYLFCCELTAAGFHLWAWRNRQADAFPFSEKRIASTFAWMYGGHVVSVPYREWSPDDEA